MRAPEGEVRIAVVGKYTNLLDSYKSLAEALAHGGIANKVRVQLDWVDSEVFEQPDSVQRLDGVHGILVPGGFGERGTAGKIAAVRFARERNVPFLGICFGMQMAVIEAARNLAGLAGASSTDSGHVRSPWWACSPNGRAAMISSAGAPARSRRHHAPRRVSRDAGKKLPGQRHV